MDEAVIDLTLDSDAESVKVNQEQGIKEETSRSSTISRTDRTSKRLSTRESKQPAEKVAWKRSHIVRSNERKDARRKATKISARKSLKPKKSTSVKSTEAKIRTKQEKASRKRSHDDAGSRSSQSNKRRRKDAKPPIVKTGDGVIVGLTASEVKQNKHEEAYWEIEKIIGKRQTSRRVEYLVKWKGCSEDDSTWEPVENLCDSAYADAIEFSKNEKLKEKNRKEEERKLGLEGNIDERNTEAVTFLQVGTSRPSKISRNQKRSVKSDERDSGAKLSIKVKSIGEEEDDSWLWNDAEQIQFCEIERIHVDSKNARERITENRINGIPFVIVGHIGWANFAMRWLKKRKVEDVTETSDKDDSDALKTHRADAIPSKKMNEVKDCERLSGGEVCVNENDDVKIMKPQHNDATSSKNMSEVKASALSSSDKPGLQEIHHADIMKPQHDVTTSSKSANDVKACELSSVNEADSLENHDSAMIKPQHDAKTTHKRASEVKACARSSVDEGCSNERHDSKVVKPQHDAVASSKNISGVKDLAPSLGNQMGRNENKTRKNKKSPILNQAEEVFEPLNIKPEKLDLSDPSLMLDIPSLLNDIGDEDVPVVRKNYNEHNPIHGVIPISKFLKLCWSNTISSSINQGINSDNMASPSTRPAPQSPLCRSIYLHQWQFPLSESAGYKLCRKNKPLNSVLGEDLLAHWLDLPQCAGDNPLQYLFMGREETNSKLHCDNGGLAITIAPIVGQKECVLVHRLDGTNCLYHLNASLTDPDLDRYPLLINARMWKSIINPGEILFMPAGTYHQCRNITPCLSYSRFHLDDVNLSHFLRSYYDEDAPEIVHDEILWNASIGLMQKVEKIVDETSGASGGDGRRVTEEEYGTVKTLRKLRNFAKDICRRSLMKATMKGKNVEKEEPKHNWFHLVNDIDISLHEFRYRKFGSDAPTFKSDKNLKSIGLKMMDKNFCPAIHEKGKKMVAYNTELEQSYLNLPNLPQSWNTIPLSEIKVNDVINVALCNKVAKARVLKIVHNSKFAFLSYEEYPRIYDEWQQFNQLRSTKGDGAELQEAEVKTGIVVLNRWGNSREEYRGKVQKTTSETMLEVEFNGLGSELVIRWTPLTAITKLFRNAKSGAKNVGSSFTTSLGKTDKDSLLKVELTEGSIENKEVENHEDVKLSGSCGVSKEEKEHVLDSELIKTIAKDEGEICNLKNEISNPTLCKEVRAIQKSDDDKNVESSLPHTTNEGQVHIVDIAMPHHPSSKSKDIIGEAKKEDSEVSKVNTDNRGLIYIVENEISPMTIPNEITGVATA